MHIPTSMSQEQMIKFECTECKTINYFSRKNKKTIKDRLELKKFCKHCKNPDTGKKGTATLHKETK